MQCVMKLVLPINYKLRVVPNGIFLVSGLSPKNNIKVKWFFLIFTF